MAVLHSGLGGSDLHPPLGVDPDPLDLTDGLGSAMRWRSDDGVNQRDILIVDIASAVHVFQFGNSTDGAVLRSIGTETSGAQLSKTEFPELSADPAAVANAAVVYSKDVAGDAELFARTDTGVYQLTPPAAGGGGGSLDAGYDFGGAGAGRIITADTGPVRINVSTSDGRALDIDLDGPLAAGNPGIDLNFGTGAWTGIANGINIGYAGMTSLTDASDSRGIQLTGITNAGAGDSVGVYISGFDKDIELAGSAPTIDVTSADKLLIGRSAVDIGTVATQNVLVGLDLLTGRTGTGIQNTVVGHSANISSNTTLQATVYGYSASAGNRATAVGPSSSSTGTESVAYGYLSNASTTRCTALGRSATASATEAIAIGPLVTASHAYAIVMGRSAVSDKVNQMVIGGPVANGGEISEMIIGATDTDPTPPTVTLRASNSTAVADNDAGDLILVPGVSTGSGDMGSFIVQQAPELAASTTLNTVEDRFEVAPEFVRWRGAYDKASSADAWVFQVSGNGQTVNLGTANVAILEGASFPDGVLGMYGMATGTRDNGGTIEGVSVLVHGAFIKDGGTLTLLGSSVINSEADTNVSSATAAFVVVSGDAVLQVTGQDGTTIDWQGFTFSGFVRD